MTNQKDLQRRAWLKSAPFILMIQLSAAGKRFGPKLLFENLDWLITPDERVGLVGANGTGKSTLLKVLGGIESLDYGTIVSAKNTTFGYLPQDGLQLSGRTVFDECMSVFANLRALEQEMEDLTHKMARTRSQRPPSTRKWPTATSASSATSA